MIVFLAHHFGRLTVCLGTPRYTCGHPTCTTHFLKWTQLLTHTRTAHPPICSVCQKSFTTRSSLKSHLKTHDSKRETIKCTWEGCKKVFMSEKARNVHVRTGHEGVRAWVCDWEGCGRGFGHKHEVVRHRRVVHEAPKQRKPRSDTIPKPNILELLTGDQEAYNQRVGRKIPCPFGGCVAKFRRESDLEKHVELAHVGKEEEIGDGFAEKVNAESVEEVEREMFGEDLDADGSTDGEWSPGEEEGNSEDL
ncbi:hypothetical protein HK097_010352 [Rhizophlyctis rosea]|uniref:C2H2-type domain-containing protein n=1 Tax=Rhizophlyctis rosea TaxID=64517 RepID=A0AAD5X820_9FUNG|nr:hypothetical protein HK097_010352 [Rhizophlyctis rosea]